MTALGKLEIGVVGCGQHSRYHLQHYGDFPAAEVVAVADVDRARARQVAGEFGVPHHYGDHRELLARHQLDIVSLSLPPACNRAVAIAALEAGAHVMISKPLALNPAQAEDIIATARRGERLVSMALQNRCLHTVRALRRFISSGRLGQVYHTRIWNGHVMHIPATPTMRQRHLAGGGVVFHTLVHLLDAALWILGNPRPRRAGAKTSRNNGKPDFCLQKTPQIAT